MVCMSLHVYCFNVSKGYMSPGYVGRQDEEPTETHPDVRERMSTYVLLHELRPPVLFIRFRCTPRVVCSLESWRLHVFTKLSGFLVTPWAGESVQGVCCQIRLTRKRATNTAMKRVFQAEYRLLRMGGMRRQGI